MMVGVDIGDGEVVAVTVDHEGGVTARIAVSAKGADLVLAATSAVERVTPASSGPSSLGIAVSSLDTATAPLVFDALASRYAALFPQRAALGQGTAGAVAESWVGAARGVADVVYFAIAEHTTAGVIRNGQAIAGAHGR